MTDRPILFSTSMVRALLEGRKTQTRRLLYSHRKAKGGIIPGSATELRGHRPPVGALGEYYTLSVWQKVQPGDRLWVRETWAIGMSTGNSWHSESGPVGDMTKYQRRYAADNLPGFFGRWRSPIHCSRWASRLTLVVTATKIEPVQNIDWDDAMAEGCALIQSGTYGFGEGHARWSSPQFAFTNLWADLHGKKSWDANPEVVALTFAVHKQNIDATKEAA